MSSISVIALISLLRLGNANKLVDCEYEPGVHTDYSNMNLTAIPQNFSKTTTTLDLSHNAIREFPDYSFAYLAELRSLNLPFNLIYKLHMRSLFGLERLCYLNLQFIKLTMTYDSYPLLVFSHVPQLQELILANNKYEFQWSYPDQTFKYLHNLRKLSVDAFSGLKFGQGFAELTSLVEFHTNTGKLGIIRNSTFIPFKKSRLKRLILRQCGITDVEIGAFEPLSALEVLDLSGNRDIGLPNGLQALYGLQGQNMSDIILKKINPVRFRFNSTVVDSFKARFLVNICAGNIDLGENYISFFDFTIFTKFRFPNCLVRFSIRGHNLISVFTGSIALVRFRNLKYLDGSGTKKSKFLNVIRPRKGTDVHTDILKLRIPPSLEFLNLSHVFGSIGLKSQVEIVDGSKLGVVDLSFDGFNNCLSPIYGCQNLRVLNISQSSCSILSPHLLNSMPGLEVLVLENVQLNTGLTNDPNGIFLRHQRNLTSLNMADNGLTNLHRQLFSTLKLNEVLSLANNKLLAIPQAVRSMTSLKQLDMSYNAMTNVNEADRKWLDQMSDKRSGGFILSLKVNPLSCTCSTFYFIQWLLETKVHVTDKDSLECTLENGTKALIVSLYHELNDFHVRCIGTFWLVFSVCASSVVIVCLFVTVIGYRYRWNIQYWFLTKCRGGYEPLPPANFQYDAFVAYNHENYRWACFTLREFLEDEHCYCLCLHHRDFPVGESIHGNIVDAINSSRKIILVISRQFLACNWGEFEIRMAGMHMVQSGRDNVVIAIMLEEIPVQQMPKILLDMWQKVTFLLWTNDRNDQNIFWKRLEEAFKRP